ncbi:hypothetical protein QNH20_25415 [Neobacillus sp. WH10]|uniref:hypothetical protein n=1 Tax=Neobacillus sp. WH10 TaxID=3047873 RepID=UPI0024C16A7E|nr:hypothetical protein [Neobacillus sp. WH10]WHY77365.1 hypothetical protein QNH20_25415 [Neobacillus sp. WH10]
MGRELGSIFYELKLVKNKELGECDQELNYGNHNHIVKKALLMYKHGLLENLEMYDHYLDSNKETIL